MGPLQAAEDSKNEGEGDLRSSSTSGKDSMFGAYMRGNEKREECAQYADTCSIWMHIRRNGQV